MKKSEMKKNSMNRQNFADLIENSIYSKSLLQIFNNVDNEGKDDLYKDLVFVEMLFYFHTEIFGLNKFKQRDPISLLANHEEIIFLSKKYNKFKLNKTLFLMRNVYDPYYIEEIIRLYFSIPSEFRIFKLDNEEVVRNKGKYFNDRDEIYKRILLDKKVTSHKERNRTFITEKNKKSKLVIPLENYNEYKNHQEKKYREINHIFPESSLKKEHEFELTKLIEKRLKEKETEKKNNKDLNNYLPNKNTYLKMKHSYPDRFKNLNTYKIKDRKIINKKVPFYFEEVNHVIATTGAGKSTLTHGLIFSICEKRNGKIDKKVVIFTNNTQDTLNEKNKLEKIGLKVAPVIGNSDIKKHRETFIKNNIENYKNPLEFIKERKDDLKILDSNCSLKNELDPNCVFEGKAQCTNLKIGLESFVCPYYDDCSFHYKYRKMLEADVWIGTPEAFFNVYAPYQYDKYERNFLELAILWSDLIIVDEVDNIQKRFDNLFIDQLPIVSGKVEKNNISNFFADYLFSIIHNIDKTKTRDPFISNYIEKVNDLQNTFFYLYAEVMTGKYLKDKITNPFTSKKILIEFFSSFFETTGKESDIKKISRDISDQLKDFHKMKKTISEEAKNKMINLYELLKENKINNIEKRKREKEKKKIIFEFVSFITEKLPLKLKDFSKIKKIPNMKLKPEEIENIFIKEFEFILFFSKIEGLLNFLNRRYVTFDEKINFKNKISFDKNIFSKNNPFKLLAPKAYTSDFSSFRFLEKNDKTSSHLILYLFEYKGVGRDLLYKINDFFCGVERNIPPKLLFLSATSDMPESSHYLVDVSPNWLIENPNQKNQQINITSCGVLDEKGETIFISGSNNPSNVFKEITKKIYESDFLKDIEKKHKKMIQDEKNEILNRIKKLSADGNNFEELKKSKLLFSSLNEESEPCLALVVKSFEKAEWVAKSLISQGYPVDDMKVLYSNEPKYGGEKIEKEEYHISANEVEELYKYNPKIFVCVRESLARGYNILSGKNSNRSLLRSICYYERPHPTPDNFEEMVLLINSSKQKYKNKIKDKGKNFLDAENYLRQQANKDLYDLFDEGSVNFSSLDNKSKKMLAANELAITIQMSGRGTRSVNSLDVYFLDAKMVPATFEKNLSTFDESDPQSMLAIWKKILTDVKDPLVQRVQKNWVAGLSNVKIKYIF